jgi:hypothetical protein
VKEMNLALRSIFVHTSKRYLTCRKILRLGADDFASLPKEVVLRTCMASETHGCRPGLNAYTLDPTARHN